MKAFTHTIIVFVASILLAAGLAPAQNVTDAGEAEIAAEVAQMQIQTAQRQAEVAMVLAQVPAGVPATPTAPVMPVTSPVAPPMTPPVSAVNNNVSNLTRSLSFGSRGSRAGSTGTVLVIPSEQTPTEDLLKMNEDMSVMSRIFEKNLGNAPFPSGRPGFFGPRHDSFSMLLGGGRGGIQSIYLQGFGALFLMNVDFPLTPPPDMQDDEKETQKIEQGDPVWQKMRQEMYEPEKVDRYSRTDRPEEQYDAEKVENLKTTLIKALKHAANIRSLKNDESVILTITGKGQATGSTIAAARMLPGENQILIRERTADGKTITKMVTGTSLDVLDDIGLSSPTILVIRAKKSDIDEFAKGDLDFEKFRQRVQLLTYPLLTGVDERGGTFDLYYNNIIGSRPTGSSNRR